MKEHPFITAAVLVGTLASLGLWCYLRNLDRLRYRWRKLKRDWEWLQTQKRIHVRGYHKR